MDGGSSELGQRFRATVPTVKLEKRLRTMELKVAWTSWTVWTA